MSERLTRPMRGIQDRVLDTIYSRDMCTNLLWTSYTRRENFRQTHVVFYRRMYVAFWVYTLFARSAMDCSTRLRGCTHLPCKPVVVTSP